MSKSLSQWWLRSASGNNLLPALPINDLHYRHTLNKHVISPYHPTYRWWKIWLVVLVVYSAWASPFELAFREAATGCLMYVDLFVDVFFTVDIVVTFFVAYLDKSTHLLVDRHTKIASRYIRKLWFPMDVASTIPFEVMHLALMNQTSNGVAFGFLNLLRLWRLNHVKHLFKRLEKDRRLSYFWIRTLKLVCVTLLTVHVAACVFYWLAVHHKEQGDTWIGKASPDLLQKSIWIRYTYSLYWSVVTFTSVGYGDFVPVTIEEKLFAMLYMLFNMALTAYVIGHITLLAVHSASSTFAMRNSINKIVEFGSKNRVPEGLKEQMVANMQLKLRTQEMRQEQVMNHLPKAIKSSIAQHLFRGTVASTYLFKGVSNEFIHQLVSEMKSEYLPPKVDIILQNETPTDFYFIVSGAMEMLTYKDGIEQVVAKLECEDIAGEIGVLLNIPQPFTIRTKRLSHVIKITHAHYNQIIHQHNADGNKIMSNFVQYLNTEMQEEMSFLTALLNRKHPAPYEDCVRLNQLGDMKTKVHIRRRVIIHNHHPNENREEGNRRGKLVLVPNSIQELFKISEEKFGKRGSTILMVDASQVEDINVLRDNDNLFII